VNEQNVAGADSDALQIVVRSFGGDRSTGGRKNDIGFGAHGKAVQGRVRGTGGQIGKRLTRARYILHSSGEEAGCKFGGSDIE
jgi:hypothetical protein